jgi:hypothetical protein
MTVNDEGVMSNWSNGTRNRWTPGLLGSLVLGLAAVAPAGIIAADPSAVDPTRRQNSGLEERVAAITRALDLDASQQGAVRWVLRAQREEAQRIWEDESVPSAIRIAETRALSRRTAERIRALLNAKQRERYVPSFPGQSESSVSSARVEDWLGSGKAH